MSDQTKIQTVGPADVNAKIRQYRYTAAAFITAGGPALALALAQGGVSKWIAFAIAIGGVLTGTLENANAARKVAEQRNNGTFDEAPPDPVGNVFEQLGILKGEVDRTVTEATGKAADAAAVIQGVVSLIPGGQALSNAVYSGSVGDLIQAVADRADR